MLVIENTNVSGWEAAIRGMRNPMNSWDKSDTTYSDSFYVQFGGKPIPDLQIGAEDLKLMKRLIAAGSDHRKFLRYIVVTMDVTAPLYWWKEFDTYKIGTVANSCSTMHKIHSKEFTLDDFSHEHLLYESETVLSEVIDALNGYRKLYNETNNKDYWLQMIQLLPTSYNQKRTIQLNYEVIMNIFNARKNHKLNEWREFCDWISLLPYAKTLIC